LEEVDMDALIVEADNVSLDAETHFDEARAQAALEAELVAERLERELFREVSKETDLVRRTYLMETFSERLEERLKEANAQPTPAQKGEVPPSSLQIDKLNRKGAVLASLRALKISTDDYPQRTDQVRAAEALMEARREEIAALRAKRRAIEEAIAQHKEVMDRLKAVESMLRPLTAYNMKLSLARRRRYDLDTMVAALQEHRKNGTLARYPKELSDPEVLAAYPTLAEAQLAVLKAWLRDCNKKKSAKDREVRDLRRTNNKAPESLNADAELMKKKFDSLFTGGVKLFTKAGAGATGPQQPSSSQPTSESQKVPEDEFDIL